jgi:uncharacterized cupin superfamily protein
VRRIRLPEAVPVEDPEDPEGFRARMDRFGARLGAEHSGASLYELPPGQALCPYHYEHGEEEWALVLEGRPSVRTPEGIERLDPLDLLFFPTGPAGAHQLRNDSDAPARVLMWSTVVYPAVTSYPDSGKVGVYTRGGADNLIVERSSGVGYYAGETGAAHPPG